MPGRAGAAWDPQDSEEAVTWAFYAYENCVAALAEATETTWKKTHWNEAAIARLMVASRNPGFSAAE